ncbi:MAG: lysophospholipid acyltransferase family protein [Gemmatimonadaceae bacterium]
MVGLRMLGWQVTGAFPNTPKFVVIVAPHTSNWDFVIGILAYLAIDIDASWLGKHSIFRWPFGPILRRVGGIPVRRDSSHNVVDQSVAEFARRDRLVLGIAPEGTRRRVPSWRSGFYHIATGARVPIVTAALDFGNREFAIGPTYQPTGDYAVDLALFASRFAAITPKNPELYEPSPRP